MTRSRATPRLTTSPPSSTARWSSAARPVARVYPVSSASPSTVDTSSSSAAAERADTGHGTAAGALPVTVSRAGGASRMTCAFVPLTPKDDTAARRGRSVSGHAVGSVTRFRAPAVQSTWDDGSATCSVFGTTAWPRESTILITPAAPAAAWVCPRLDFTDPSSTGVSRSCP